MYMPQLDLLGFALAVVMAVIGAAVSIATSAPSSLTAIAARQYHGAGIRITSDYSKSYTRSRGASHDDA